MILTITQASEVAAVGTFPALANTLSIGTGSASTIAAICIVVSVFLEHFYRYRPSAFLSAYLTITVLFDIIRLRLVCRQEITALGILAAVGAGSKLALMILLEDVPSRSIFLFKEIRMVMNRLSVAGAWIRASIISLKTIFLRGFRTPLSLDDIDELDGDLQSETAIRTFQQHWNKGILNLTGPYYDWTLFNKI